MPTHTLILVLLFGSGILLFHRRTALVLVVVCITLVPVSSLDIGSAHFFPIRIVITLGLLRTILRGEFLHNFKLNKIDWAILLWSLLLIFSRLLKTREDVSIILRFGEVFDTLGVYLLFRCLMIDMEDIKAVFKALACTFCLMAIFMIYEKTSGNNLFSHLGGVAASPKIRDGSIRCQGPFAHSILAGTVAATSSSWFIVLISQRNRLRGYGYVGFLTCLIIVFLTASSGPILSLISVLIGFCVYIFRNHMRSFRTVVLLTLIFLHLVMKAPVWYLIARVDLTGNSTGWHRSELIDTSIRHLDEWWFLGTDYTAHWMPTGVSWSDRHTDITNYYLTNGINGGIATLVVFVWILASGFSLLGTALKRIPINNRHYRFIAWGIGCSLFAHAVSFLSVNYFDQSQMFLFLVLAMAVCIHEFSLMTASKRKELYRDHNDPFD